MSLVPVMDRAEAASAFGVLRDRLTSGAAARADVEVGWPGGRRRLTLQWRRERFWTHFGEAAGHYLFWLGTDNPAKAARVAITCEINAPREGINRKWAGALVRDVGGRLYLAHSGRIGGAGLGPHAFARGFAGANWQTALWPDGSQSEMHVIAPIEGPRLAVQLAYFVHEVRRLNAALKSGESNGPLLPEPRFWPELARARRPARRIGPIEAQCDRGLVLAALHDALLAAGLRVQAAGMPDLVTIERGRVRHVFAVHTDATRGGLTAAIGRLFLTTAPRRVLVHPGKTPPEIAAAGVQVLSYRWASGRPVFDPAMQRLQ